MFGHFGVVCAHSSDDLVWFEEADEVLQLFETAVFAVGHFEDENIAIHNGRTQGVISGVNEQPIGPTYVRGWYR